MVSSRNYLIHLPSLKHIDDILFYIIALALLSAPPSHPLFFCAVVPSNISIRGHCFCPQALSTDNILMLHTLMWQLSTELKDKKKQQHATLVSMSRFLSVSSITFSLSRSLTLSLISPLFLSSLFSFSLLLHLFSLSFCFHPPFCYLPQFWHFKLMSRIFFWDFIDKKNAPLRR